MPPPAVYGLIAFPIPTPEGDLTRLVRRYAHLLGAAGGEVLLWRRLGDPRLTDAVYRGQRTEAMKAVDEASAAEYDARVAEFNAAGRTGAAAERKNSEFKREREQEFRIATAAAMLRAQGDGGLAA